jgi:hypothetical protein
MFGKGPLNLIASFIGFLNDTSSTRCLPCQEAHSSASSTSQRKQLITWSMPNRRSEPLKSSVAWANSREVPVVTGGATLSLKLPRGDLQSTSSIEGPARPLIDAKALARRLVRSPSDVPWNRSLARRELSSVGMACITHMTLQILFCILHLLRTQQHYFP